MKLYEDLDADFELMIGKRERELIFFNAISAEHWNEFVSQLKKYSESTIDDFVNYFQILHAQDVPHCEEKHCEDKENQNCKEANKEMDATNKCNAACKQDAAGYNDTACKQPHQVFARGGGNDVAWRSCKHHNFCHPEYRKSSGSAPCSHAQSDCDCGNKHRQDHRRSCSRSRSCDCQNCQDWDHKPAPCNCKEQNYHANDCDHL